MKRRYEPGEDGSRRVPRRYPDDGRQHALHPRRFPNAASRENALHIDNEMHGIGDRFESHDIRQHASAPSVSGQTSSSLACARFSRALAPAGNALNKPEFTFMSQKSASACQRI
jgi:hypothetical protein